MEDTLDRQKIIDIVVDNFNIIMNLPAVFFFESTRKQTTDTTVVVHRIVVTIIIIPTAISTVGNAVQQKELL